MHIILNEDLTIGFIKDTGLTPLEIESKANHADI